MSENFVVGFLVSFKNLNKFLNTYKFTLNYFSERFKNVCIINSENLTFYGQKDTNRDKNIYFNKKIKFINPQNTRDFNNFVKKKKVIIINSIGWSFNEYKVHLTLNKENIQQIMISNVGNINDHILPQSLSRRLNLFFFKRFPYLLALIFYECKIFKKISIRFTSNYFQFKNFKKNFFSITKNIEIINSRNFDEMVIGKKKISSKYIVFLDHSLNHPEWIINRGFIKKSFQDEVYKITEKFLFQLYKFYKKKIIVCIHPTTEIKIIKKLLPKFRVLKFKTVDTIYNADIVVFSDSSAIVDAITLRKKIINIKDIITDSGKLNFLHNYQNFNFTSVSLANNLKLIKKKLDKSMGKSLKKYKNYEKLFSNSDGKKIGVHKIVDYIQRLK